MIIGTYIVPVAKANVVVGAGAVERKRLVNNHEHLKMLYLEIQ